MFGVGVGEGKVLGDVFGVCGGGEKVCIFEMGAVEVAGAERVDLLQDVRVDTGVEGVQMRVCIGGGYVYEFGSQRGGEGDFCHGEGR